jgi:hypothetical protein
MAVQSAIYITGILGQQPTIFRKSKIMFVLTWTDLLLVPIPYGTCSNHILAVKLVFGVQVLYGELKYLEGCTNAPS